MCNSTRVSERGTRRTPSRDAHPTPTTKDEEMEHRFHRDGDQAGRLARSRASSFTLQERVLLSVLAAIFCLLTWFVEMMPDHHHDL